MAVIRNRPREQFTQIRNKALRDVTLSLKAKGLLAVMLSFSDEWSFNIEHLTTLTKDERDAHRAAMRELIAAGYVARVQLRRPDGVLDGSEYVVSDERQTADGFSGAGQPGDGLPGAGESNTKNTNPKNINSKNKKSMSPDGDAGASGLGSGRQQEGHKDPSNAHGRTQSGKAASKAGKGSAKAGKEVPGGAAFDELCRILVNIWNEHRGKLPAVRVDADGTVSPARQKLITAFIKNVGADAAASIWLDAVRMVATEEYWVKEGYGFDNLCRHAEAKAEKWQAKQGEPKASASNVRRDGYDGKGWV